MDEVFCYRSLLLERIASSPTKVQLYLSTTRLGLVKFMVAFNATTESLKLNLISRVVYETY